MSQFGAFKMNTKIEALDLDDAVRDSVLNDYEACLAVEENLG